ncbi:MAG: UDP-N-acetylmuramoyl-L-alanyl-D-glutamate--2,6-diaminopimelate ligase [Bifidobacteriaceae bacterium]|jgi:UDP-N-acetylmuramoyl-L-alanyl-D-glutamate--2,6-diaminopimelate ligase|nr:UDP-N-acetylmuramoyl-L-alanyl-D-glutamate--2,6-diaminopimelate ligase [Bifidobacteriaceae bacterium]
MLRPDRSPRATLADAARQVPGARLAGGPAGAGGGLLGGVTLSSAEVRPGDLFAALPGAKTHGARHAGAALAAGAAAVLTDPAGEALLPPATPRLVVADPRARLGPLAAWLYGYPARRLKLVGVTGTNGKTTVAHLLESALARRYAKVALLGTVLARVDGRELASERTTLEAPALQAALAAMAERGVEACVMEVSSHALALHRVDGLVFDVAAFTNLTRDHLDFHGAMGDYFAAKAALFTPGRARLGVIGLADGWSRQLARTSQIERLTVSREPADQPDWLVAPGPPARDGTAFELVRRAGPARPLAAAVRLPGAYNVDNAAVALVSAIAAGVAPKAAAAGVRQAAPVPGRMERVAAPPGAPQVVVDYAHAPASVAAALAALRPHTPGRLIAVLGAGGERDHGKREAMGAAAAQGADLVYVTDDNPRGEDPAAIRAAVLAGAGAQAREVASRAGAIGQAIKAAEGQDTVVILGKGHEAAIDYGGQLRPHQDNLVAGAALRARMEDAG